MVRQWRNTALLVLGMLVLGAATWLLTKDSPSDKTTTPSKPNSESIGVRWMVGATQHYRFEFLSSMQMHTSANAPVQIIPVNMQGNLTLHTLYSGANNVSNGIKLSEVELSISGQNDALNISALEQPFRVRYASGGIPVSTEFPNAVDAESREILQSLIRTFQFTLIKHADQWTAEESNASGSYVADYTREEPEVFSKRKRDFKPSSENVMLTNAIVTSTETLRTDPLKNWIVAMNVDERLSNSESGGPGLQITNQASLTLITDPPTAPDTRQWEFDATDVSQKNSMMIAQENQNSTLPISSMTALSPEQAREEMLAELSTLDAAVQARSPHIHRLRDLLQADDSLPALLVQQMSIMTMSDRTRADLYLALELAGTAAAQRALTDIIAKADWSLKDSIRATIALAGVSKPEPSTISTLWETADTDNQQLASTALFALGSLGSTLNSADDESYTALRDNLLGNAYSSEKPLRKADYISALGNTRDNALEDDLANLLDDKDSNVRRATAQALGQVGTAISTTTLTNNLQQESSGTVRAAMVDALTELPDPDEAGIRLITSMIQTEADEQARFAMAGYLEKHVAAHARYKPVLQTLIRHEPSKRVRQRLGEALASLVIR